jgi:Mg2+ and Co2+ transporter CorA
MTRSDAQTNIVLAKAAREDSYSMKTIAVMTMAFLPATYLAALFAVPSLKWDSGPVITNKFWIYWAFAIPSTALTFLFWGVFTKWNLSKKFVPRIERVKTE